MRFWVRCVAGAVVLIGVIAAGGCGTYLTRYSYTPGLAQVDVDLAATGSDPDARVLVTIVGIRRELPHDAERMGIDLKLRAENLGGSPVRLDPVRVVVVDGGLNTLDGPLDPPAVLDVPAGGELTATLSYGLPRGAAASDEAMKGLSVRVQMTVGDVTLTRSVGFTQQYDDYSGRYDYPYGYPYGYGFYGFYGWRGHGGHHHHHDHGHHHHRR